MKTLYGASKTIKKLNFLAKAKMISYSYARDKVKMHLIKKALVTKKTILNSFLRRPSTIRDLLKWLKTLRWSYLSPTYQ